MKKATREWVRKAEADFLWAGMAARGSDRLYDGVCFHSQQCTEKYLKGLMEELGLPVPRTLVLKDLLALLRPHHPSLSRFRPGLTILTRLGLNPHYSGDSATKRQAATALRWAERVRAACRALLGIQLPRPRRKKPS